MNDNYKKINKEDWTVEQLDHIAEQMAFNFLYGWYHDPSTSDKRKREIKQIIGNYTRTRKDIKQEYNKTNNGDNDMNKETNDILKEILDTVKNNKCNCVSTDVEETVLPPSVRFATEEHLKKVRLRKVQEKVENKQEENKVLTKSEIRDLSTNDIMKRMLVNVDYSDKDKMIERLNLRIEFLKREALKESNIEKRLELLNAISTFKRIKFELIVPEHRRYKSKKKESFGSYTRTNETTETKENSKKEFLKKKIKEKINELQNDPFDIDSAKRLIFLTRFLYKLENTEKKKEEVVVKEENNENDDSDLDFDLTFDDC